MYFDKTGGEYRKARVKLSQYDYYFNEDGSRTGFFDGHDYYFKGTEVVGDHKFMSTLMIVSGGCVTFVTPDKDGFVEFYVSSKFGQWTSFSTDYYVSGYNSKGEYVFTNGGGNSGTPFGEFTKGVVDGGGFVTIYDATDIQRNIAKSLPFTKMQTYRADVNNDGVITVMDATLIQRYLAKIEV